MLLGRRRGPGRPPKGYKKRKWLIRLILVGIFLAGTSFLLFKTKLVGEVPVVEYGKSVLGKVSVTDSDATSGNVSEKALSWFKRQWSRIAKSAAKDFAAGSSTGVDEIVVKFAVVADSHEDESFFPQILKKIKMADYDFLIHLGDLTNDGEKGKLLRARQLLETVNIDYHVIPGDHDLNWFPRRDSTNFQEVFGPPHKSFFYKGIAFLLIDNSSHERGISNKHKDALQDFLIGAKSEGVEQIFAFTHVPLYNERFPAKVMGESTGKAEVIREREWLLDLLADFDVNYVFSGDVHYYSRYFEPERGLDLVTVGAACGNRCKNFLPQYVEVEVYRDGKIEIIPRPYKELEEIRGELK